VLAAAAELGDEGIAAHVIDVTSADRLYRAWQRTLRQGVRTATTPSIPGALRTVFPDRAPIVTVHDAASHPMSWLGSALGVPAVSLGVDSFGQSGAVSDLYRAHDLDAGSIVNAARGAVAALSKPKAEQGEVGRASERGSPGAFRIGHSVPMKLSMSLWRPGPRP
jgi:pyruvate dehydrogenase E1 component